MRTLKLWKRMQGSQAARWLWMCYGDLRWRVQAWPSRPARGASEGRLIE